MFKYDLLPHLSKAGQLLTTSVRITGWFGRSYRRWKSSSESPDRLGTFSLSVHSAGNSRFAHCWFDQACERVRERVKEWGGLRSGIGRRAATHVVALVEEVGVHRLGPRECCGPPGGLDLLPPPLEPVPEVPSGTTGEGRSFGSAPSRREREKEMQGDIRDPIHAIHAPGGPHSRLLPAGEEPRVSRSKLLEGERPPQLLVACVG